MSYGMYISAEGAHAQNKRLETIANNLANVDTVGFKRQLSVFQARYAEAVNQGTSMASPGTIDNLGGGVMVRDTPTDFSQGPIRHTKIATDMAIQGEGFFTVRKGEDTFLTRAGNFRVTPRGELVTQEGYAVLDDGASPVVLEQPERPFEVTPKGEIRQGNTSRTLGVVTLPVEELQQTGENLYRALGEPRPVEDAQRSILSGSLEASGVTPTNEMVAMIETSRLVEANVNMMQTQDQMTASLLSRLTRVN